MGQNLSIASILDLSHLRRRLFAGAEAPATVVIALNSEPDRSAIVQIRRSTRMTVPVTGENVRSWTLLRSDAETDTCRVADLIDRSWLGPLMLSADDRRLAWALEMPSGKGRQNFKSFLNQSSLLCARGGDRTETGLADVPMAQEPAINISHRSDRLQKNQPFWPISNDELAKARGDFANRFAGSIILLPRSLNDVKFLQGPHAYRSTFKGIYTRDPELRSDTSFITGMRGLARFLDSNVTSYFAALYGATYMMLGDRLELGDLERFPVPYTSILDPKLAALADEHDVDAAILNAFDAGSEFRRLFAEHSSFGKDFGNGKLPITAFDQPTDDLVEDYRQRLNYELDLAFGQGYARLTVDTSKPSVIALHVAFGESATAALTMPSCYIGTTTVAIDPSRRNASIFKSAVRHGFTLRQASSDATILVRQVAV
jgi:hypothetical protein